MTKGVTCYIPGCKATFNTWGKLLDHFKNTHKILHSRVAGTYLHEMAMKDKGAHQTQKRKADKEAGTGPANKKPATKVKRELPDGDQTAPQADGNGDQQVCAPKEVKAEPQGGQQDSAAAGQGSTVSVWKDMRCWVKCDLDGTPLEPFICGGPCASVTRPDLFCQPSAGAGNPSKQQSSLDVQMKPAMAPKPVVLNNATGPPGPLSMVPAAQDQVEQTSQNSEAPGNVLHPVLMMKEMHTMMKQMNKDPTLWKKELPMVAVNAVYLELNGPKAKRDGDCSKALWPRKLRLDKVMLPAFQEWLDKENKHQGHLQVMLRCVGRALGALEVNGQKASTIPAAIEAPALVALYTSKESNKLFGMNLFNPKYSWTLKTIDSMSWYCSFHLSQCTDKQINCEPGPWKEYINVLNAFQKEMKGGLRKKCVEQKRKFSREKMCEDRAAIKNFPIVQDMRKCLKEAYICLRIMSKQFAGKPALSKAARGEANGIVAAAIYLDTFGGRKLEWELAGHDYIKGQLDKGMDYIVCSHHKTAKTYGDLAKYLSPGLQECFKCYLELPRPNECPTFLVPPVKAKTVSIPGALKNFCARYWPQDKTKLQVNYMRKYFHNTLMKLTDSAEKLKDLMVIIDAHSKQVQDKVYIMRDPEDDVKLARELVKTIFGSTVAWPTDEEVSDYEASNSELSKWLADIISEDTAAGQDEAEEQEQEEEEEDEGEDDLDLEWWEFGKHFGIMNPEDSLAPIADSSDHVAPIADLPEVVELKDVVQEAVVPGAVVAEPKDCKNKKFNAIPEAKLKLYEEYTIAAGSNKRMAVPGCAKQFFEDQLKEWQTQNGFDQFALPYSNEWYYDLRVESIDKEMITKYHCKDVARNHLQKKYVPGLRESAEKASPANPGDID